MPNRRQLLSHATGLAALATLSASSGTPLEPGSQPPVTSQDLTRLSALGLSATIHRRDVSCREVLDAYLTQIERFNPTINAIVSQAPTEHLQKLADDRDAELRRGRSRGWMHGMPVAVKDLADAVGFPTTAGSPLFVKDLPKADSIHVARMRAAGAVFIGKTNVPEFGLGSQSYNRVFGTTGNAYDATLTAGGSSGGAAAALALGMVPVADGSDFMGSLRNPAAFNNVIGFRPTPGLVPLGDDFIEELACNGPMGRTVSDAARLLATLAGADPRSPASFPSQPDRYNAPLTRDWQGTRIAWLGDLNGYLPMETGLLDHCGKAIDGFETLGCTVDAVLPDYAPERLWKTWLTFRHWLTRAWAKPLLDNPTTRAQLKPELVWECEGGAALTGDDIAAASKDRAAWYAALLTLFERYDALVLPTTQVYPFAKTEHWPKAIGTRSMDTYHRWMEVVTPGTLAGCPVLNLSVGLGANGLPAGIQLIGRRYADLELLQLGFAYEQATRYNLDRRPPQLEAPPA
ncbi:MAG: amidase [Pseudomonadota bacterium]